MYAAFLQNAPVVRHTRGFTPGWYAVPRWGGPKASPPQSLPASAGLFPRSPLEALIPSASPGTHATQKICETAPFCVNRWDRPQRLCRVCCVNGLAG